MNTLIQKIHETTTKASIIVTGGGMSTAGMLGSVGGCSNTLVSFECPYATEETLRLLGAKKVDGFVTNTVARGLAVVAFKRAKAYSNDVIGIGSTSVLQRLPVERAGREHKIIAVLQTTTKTVQVTVKIETDLTDNFDVREREEKLNSYLILNLLAEGCGLEERMNLNIPGLNITVTRIEAEFEAGERFFNGEAITLDHNYNVVDVPSKVAVMPGSFNPAHIGHNEMAVTMEERTGRPVIWEITTNNVDKPPISFLCMKERFNSIQQFGNYLVCFTHTKYFYEKCELFKGAIFGLGMDTFIRIVDKPDVNHDIDIFISNGACFYAFSRVMNSVHITQLPSNTPPKLLELTTLLVMERPDVSSSEIRAINKDKY